METPSGLSLIPGGRPTVARYACPRCEWYHQSLAAKEREALDLLDSNSRLRERLDRLYWRILIGIAAFAILLIAFVLPWAARALRALAVLR